MLEQIRKSIRLHGTRRVILMLHSDCGAYGGLEAVWRRPGRGTHSPSRGIETRAANLARAIPGIEIEGYFVDFEGVWVTDLELAAAGAM